MCRVFGAVGDRPFNVSDELVAGSNPLIRQSEEHDSGWGMACYPATDGTPPKLARFPFAAHTDPNFDAVTDWQGRIFNVHVRRATLGGLSLENTHPFTRGPFSFGHNGTVLNYRELTDSAMGKPCGETDSEHLFINLMHDYRPEDPVASFRRLVTQVVRTSDFSGLNFLFSDGKKLYAYCLGIFELFWITRSGITMVASERLTAEPWQQVSQNVLLTLDPANPGFVHSQRLVDDEIVDQARIVALEPTGISGEERGRYAAARAAGRPLSSQA